MSERCLRKSMKEAGGQVFYLGDKPNPDMARDEESMVAFGNTYGDLVHNSTSSPRKVDFYEMQCPYEECFAQCGVSTSEDGVIQVEPLGGLPDLKYCLRVLNFEFIHPDL